MAEQDAEIAEFGVYRNVFVSLCMLLMIYSASPPASYRRVVKDQGPKGFISAAPEDQIPEPPVFNNILDMPLDVNCANNWYHDSSQTGNEVRELRTVLAQLSVKELRKFVHRHGIIWPEFDLYRDLVPGYKEGILHHRVSRYEAFQVRFLTQNDRLIWYDLTGSTDEYGNQFHVIPFASYKNEHAFNQLKYAFRATFVGEFNESELFATQVSYGENCGLGGGGPDMRNLLNIYIQNKDMEKLRKWLQSTNFEMQLYAVDGYLQLGETGIEIQENELRMMRSVLGKKGTMMTCAGCVHMMRDMSEITGTLLHEMVHAISH